MTVAEILTELTEFFKGKIRTAREIIHRALHREHAPHHACLVGLLLIEESVIVEQAAFGESGRSPWHGAWSIV
jgi:hypothetical protein